MGSAFKTDMEGFAVGTGTVWKTWLFHCCAPAEPASLLLGWFVWAGAFLVSGASQPRGLLGGEEGKGNAQLEHSLHLQVQPQLSGYADKLAIQSDHNFKAATVVLA